MTNEINEINQLFAKRAPDIEIEHQEIRNQEEIKGTQNVSIDYIFP